MTHSGKSYLEKLFKDIENPVYDPWYWERSVRPSPPFVPFKPRTNGVDTSTLFLQKLREARERENARLKEQPKKNSKIFRSIFGKRKS